MSKKACLYRAGITLGLLWVFGYINLLSMMPLPSASTSGLSPALSAGKVDESIQERVWTPYVSPVSGRRYLAVVLTLPVLKVPNVVLAFWVCHTTGSWGAGS